MNPDFDRLEKLARSSPEDFERERLTLINEALQQFDNLRRAQGIQWRIDMERSKAKTPLGACIRLSSLMWDEFHKMESSLDQLLDEVRSPIKRSANDGMVFQGADILAFKKRDSECVS